MRGAIMTRLFLVWITSTCVLLASATAICAQQDKLRPVIVIPGILGSKLCDRKTGEIVWGDRWSLTKVPRLALPAQYEPKDLPHAACGLIEAVDVLGPWQVHQYNDLLATLRGMGYEQ